MGIESWTTVRSQGRVRIRKQLWYRGPVHRLHIAEALQLSLPAVTNVINEFIQNGTATEMKAQTNGKRLGRKANLVDIQPQAKLFIGAEMRRDSRCVCLTDYRGTILRCFEDTTSYPAYSDNIQALQRLLLQLEQEPGFSMKEVHSVGIAVPGVIDTEKGVLSSHAVYGWYNCAVAEDIQKLTGWTLPIIVENDGCARAFGTRMLRRKQMSQVNRFAYLFIARGLSCPLVPCMPTDVGNPLGIGELGYMVLQADTALSSDRIAGHVSDLAGERAIMDRCHRLMREEQAPILRDICGGYTRPTIPQILEAQARGETSVQQVLTTAFEYLAIATANVCNLVRPDMIFVDSRLFHTHQNQEILTQTIRKFLVASHNTEPAFEFIASDVHNGARCAALCAIRHELDQYEEA